MPFTLRDHLETPNQILRLFHDTDNPLGWCTFQSYRKLFHADGSLKKNCFIVFINLSSSRRTPPKKKDMFSITRWNPKPKKETQKTHVPALMLAHIRSIAAMHHLRREACSRFPRSFQSTSSSSKRVAHYFSSIAARAFFWRQRHRLQIVEKKNRILLDNQSHNQIFGIP